MTREKLYDTAFRYKKAGLWKTLWDSEIFAIKLKNDKIGYVSIMGKNGEYNAMAVYIGDEGIGSYRLLFGLDPYTMPEYKYHEMIFKQNCLQVTFGSKDDLMPEEADEVRAYAKANGIRLAGKNAYPRFVKYEPGYYPWKVKTEEDMDALYEAMEASIMLSIVFTTTTPDVIGIIPYEQDETEVPLFERKGDQLHTVGLIPLPPVLKEKYEYLKAENEVAVASVKKLKKKGVWEAEFLKMFEPVQNDPEETPHFPLILLVVENKSGYMLPVSIVEFPERNPHKILEEFAKAWKMQGTCPKEIRCRDERTYALLKDFCEKADIKISIYKKLMPALDDAVEALMDRTLTRDFDEASDQLEEVIDEILSMSKDELKLIPRSLIEELKMMMEHEIFPENIAIELWEKLKGI